MGVKIQLLRGTAADWTAKNPTLDAGQPGFEIDTFKLKIGDGVLSWNDLPYVSGGFGGNDGPLEYEYDVTMYSNNTIEPSELYFNSLSNNIDFSSYFNDLITNNYTVKLKLTSVNNSNKFLITSCDTINNDPLFGDIDAFWPSRSIKWIIDGGNDQYDSSNYINTNYTYQGILTDSPPSSTLRNISIPYNGGRVTEQSQYWGNNDYVTLYKKSIWAMVAKGSSSTMPNTIFYSGNAGADGDGGKDNGTLTNYNGYQAGYARLYGDDPTYTKLIITKTGTIPSYFIDNNNDTDDDLFGASGVNSDTIAMVVFYGSDTTNPSSLSDLQTLFENFVDSVLSGSNVSQIKNNFYNNFNTLYNSVDPGFWYENFEFFTGTNNGLPNTINGEGGSGSGAIFEVTVDQENNQYTISTSAAGINYVVGDIIKIPGSNLQQPDGISPDEDIYVRVDTIDINGGVDSFSSIISINYNFINLTTLAESDGFRFFDNEKYYLNIDTIGNSSLSIPVANIDLHNGGIQSAQVLQFDNINKQSVITGPTPATDTNAQRLIIQGQRGQGTGEGGDVYIWGGDANLNGGDIKIYAGDGDVESNASGGYVNIDGGYGVQFGGDVTITGGGSSDFGGDVNIIGGDPNGVVNIDSEQFGLYHLKYTTSNSGWYSLYLDYGVNSDPDISITNTTGTFCINITGRASNGDSAGFVVRGCIKNISGTVSLVGSPIIESFLDSNFATANTQILTSGTGLIIQVDQGSSGVTGTVIWTASVKMSKTTNNI